MTTRLIISSERLADANVRSLAACTDRPRGHRDCHVRRVRRTNRHPSCRVLDPIHPPRRRPAPASAWYTDPLDPRRYHRPPPGIGRSRTHVGRRSFERAPTPHAGQRTRSTHQPRPQPAASGPRPTRRNPSTVGVARNDRRRRLEGPARSPRVIESEVAARSPTRRGGRGRWSAAGSVEGPTRPLRAESAARTPQSTS